jgi:hypothetical protein
MKRSILNPAILFLSGWAVLPALAQNQMGVSTNNAAAPDPATNCTAADKLSATPSPFDQWIKQVKHPADWFAWGADVRLRNEYVNNAATLNGNAALHEQDYFRFRERIWTSFLPVTNVSVNARLTGEQRDWMTTANAGQYGARTGFEERYGIVDNANLKWSEILDQPLTVTAGRQDIALGDPDDWWLVMDGTPSDGSWTTFFDSVRTTYELKGIQTKLDLIGIHQSAMPDEFIPTLGDSGDNRLPSGTAKPYYLTEQNEQGFIAYLSNQSVEDMQIDGYFIYKGDQRTHTDLIKNGDNADIFTIGSKITGTPAEHWSYSVEGAYQFGSKQDPKVQEIYENSSSDWRTISAYAGKFRLNYLFKDPLKNQLSLVGEFLSGDDPNTKGTDEMFDVLWGRYPRWTELGTWTYATETGGRSFQMNNLFRVGPSWSFVPMKDMTFNVMYNALFAPEAIPTRDTTTATTEQFSRDGNFRGHFLQSTLKYQFTPHVSALIKGELLCEGDYYAQQDLVSFIRTEISITF